MIPTVAVDGANQVLMVAYSNRESLRKTFDSGNVWYYSRSRERLWQKGETSGNMQKFRRIRTDCDGDALLITVDQRGAACHTGRYSCFGNRAFSLEELYDVIRERMVNPHSGSYTSSLTSSAVRQKILEEALELTEAKDREGIIWEAADLLYFITVLLAKEEVDLKDVWAELRRRRKIPKRTIPGSGRSDS